jgi:hypothetical protein
MSYWAMNVASSVVCAARCGLAFLVFSGYAAAQGPPVSAVPGIPRFLLRVIPAYIRVAVVCEATNGRRM